MLTMWGIGSRTTTVLVIVVQSPVALHAFSVTSLAPGVEKVAVGLSQRGGTLRQRWSGGQKEPQEGGQANPEKANLCLMHGALESKPHTKCHSTESSL